MRTMEDVQLEVMKVVDIQKAPLEEKAKYAYEIMKDLFKVETDGRRFKEQKNLIYMLTFYTARMANTDNTSLSSIGEIISKIEKRKSSYDHSSVIHAIRKHMERVQMGKRGGWGEYVEQFDAFCKAMYNLPSAYSVTLDAISTSIIAKHKKPKYDIYGYLPNS